MATSFCKSGCTLNLAPTSSQTPISACKGVFIRWLSPWLALSVATCDEEPLPSGEVGVAGFGDAFGGVADLQGLLDTHTLTEINGMR